MPSEVTNTLQPRPVCEVLFRAALTCGAAVRVEISRRVAREWIGPRLPRLHRDAAPKTLGLPLGNFDIATAVRST